MVFGLQYAARACKHEELERYFILLDLPAVIVIYNFIHSRRPVKCCGWRADSARRRYNPVCTMTLVYSST